MDVNDEILPTARIETVAEGSGQHNWLIENLWCESACGIIGGQPKCCKSWMGLDMAVSVASGTRCLGRYAVSKPGPVLAFMAEDRPEEVRERVKFIAQHRGLSLPSLDLHLITVPVLRLDSERDQARLRETVACMQPRLLLLDPLVRLHRLDENNAREISGLLGFLRELERTHKVAVVITHHASKRARTRPGQGLRGSSDLHAFGDSNLYISRHGPDLELAVEHRSARSIDSIRLRLAASPHVHLEMVESVDNMQDDNKSSINCADRASLEERVIEALQQEILPVKRNELRERLRVNNQKLGTTLSGLVSTGRLQLAGGGYAII